LNFHTDAGKYLGSSCCQFEKSCKFKLGLLLLSPYTKAIPRVEILGSRHHGWYLQAQVGELRGEGELQFYFFLPNTKPIPLARQP
jgi:hypothetical protein